MSSGITLYGDITPRTAAFVVKDLLMRAMPYMCIEKFGQPFVMPKNATKTATWRRYFLAGSAGSGTSSGAVGSTVLATTPLVEGVTPSGQKLDKVDISAVIQQYGDFVTTTDVVEDTHEDPILQQSTDILGEQAAMTMETLSYNIIKAGTSVRYANGTARTDVNTPLVLTLLRQATRDILRLNGRYITSIIRSTPSFNIQPVEASFVMLIHPDICNDIRNISGFIPTKQYGTTTPWENEIGAVENTRFVTSTLFTPFADGGGTKGSMISTTGTLADVYPCLLLGKNAYAIVALKGANSIRPMVVNPRPAAGDPLGQRGTIGWKTWHSAVILNDAWMVRVEVAATA